MPYSAFKITKSSSIILLIILLTLSFGNCRAQEAKTIKDPDLDLSIEELRKKYPITWMEEKYGVVIPKDCDVGEDEMELAEVESWPCGTICKKYPNVKNCPKRCYKHTDSKNLVCSFFKISYSDQRRMIKSPMARFSDFLIPEIKSAFLYYNFETGISCSIFEGNCHRSYEIMALTFAHFLNKDKRSLSYEGKLLKSFISSKKINPKLLGQKHVIPGYSNCSPILDYLEQSVENSKTQNFCLNFFN
jgi:hypothetical protein